MWCTVAAPVGGPARKRKSGSPATKPKTSSGKASNGKASGTLSKKEIKKKELVEAGADKEEIMQVDAAPASDIEADKEAEEAKDKKPLKKAVLKYPKPAAKVSNVFLA